MIRNRRVPALGLATLAAAGLTLTGAGRALADGPTEATLYVSAPGSVVRGDSVDLATYFDNSSCYGPSDSAEWSIDGVPLEDDVFDPTAGDDVGSGPGVPTGDYTRNDDIWDSTTVADGGHTATLVFSGTDCTSGAAYTETRSVSFTVDNSPIGIHFSRPNGSDVSGTSVTLSITTSDPDGTVEDVEWYGAAVKRTDGDRAVLDTSGLKGSQTITVTVTDDADVSTDATLTLEVPATTSTTAGSKAAAAKAAAARAAAARKRAAKHRVAHHRVVHHKPKKHVAAKPVAKHPAKH